MPSQQQKAFEECFHSRSLYVGAKLHKKHHWVASRLMFTWFHNSDQNCNVETGIFLTIYLPAHFFLKVAFPQAMTLSNSNIELNGTFRFQMWHKFWPSFLWVIARPKSDHNCNTSLSLKLSYISPSYNSKRIVHLIQVFHRPLQTWSIL